MTHINLVGPRAYAFELVWEYARAIKDYTILSSFHAQQLVTWLKRLAESK